MKLKSASDDVKRFVVLASMEMYFCRAELSPDVVLHTTTTRWQHSSDLEIPCSTSEF